MHNENEKRIDGREMCSELVEISFHDQRGNLVLEKGLLEDLSKDGFCISLSIPITVGLKMEFRCDGLVGIASVRYCNLGDYGYLVGAKFVDGYGWDKQRWRPKHLILLSEIASG